MFMSVRVRMFMAMIVVLMIVMIVVMGMALAMSFDVREFINIALSIECDVNFKCVNAAFENRRGFEMPAFDRQRFQLFAQLVDRRAAIEQRAQQHIAGDAGKTIEVSNHDFLFN